MKRRQKKTQKEIGLNSVNVKKKRTREGEEKANAVSEPELHYRIVAEYNIHNTKECLMLARPLNTVVGV